MTDLSTLPATIAAELKPRLRGWLHAYAAAASLAAGPVMAAVVAATRGGAYGLSATIYAITISLLFGTSAAYHRLRWSDRARRVMKKLDHSMIFIFIAGTYTPIAVAALPHHRTVVVLTVVWLGALSGVALNVGWPGAPRWLSAPCYIALGWVAVFVLPDLLHSTGAAALALILIGGIVYTLGAVVYATKRPDPWPSTFGFHEVFHGATLIAATCHYVAIWLVFYR